MCGINGFNWKDETLIREMNKRIKHRGPDDDGYYTDNSLSISQVRLSIIDLTPAGHNPMFYDKKKGAYSERHQPELLEDKSIKKLGIVFNGEIYNYQDVKGELEAKGYHFSSRCDTEVILASYQEWGFDCVTKFNGMWAFCIYDEKKNILFCSRDRLGVKPFHYYYKDGKFVFSSELKGILAHEKLKINRKENINKDAVQLYFSLGFIPSPLTIYHNVYKLEARQNIIFDLKKSRITKKWNYYDIPKYAPVYNKKKLVEEGRAILRDATKIRMMADVPVGAFLSGGLDSSTVVGVMKDFTDLKKLHTFSIGFEGKYDETKYIKLVKNYFGTKHHHYYFKKRDFEKLINKYPQVYDEPFWDYSGFPTYKVSEIARKNVTVSLSGDGGDEIFGGYMSHVTGYRMDLIYKMPRIVRKLGSKIPAKKNLNGFASLYLLKHAFRMSLSEKKYFYAKALEDVGIKPEIYKKWTTEKMAYCLKKSNNKLGEAVRMHDLLFATICDNFLVKVDRASMAHALEVRSPFLDYRFMEFAQKIPTKWKQDYIKTKILMREIIKDIIPEEILHRGKQGFSPPIDIWINDEKHKPLIKKAVTDLKGIDSELYSFYMNKVFKEDNKLYNNYKIRLFLFGIWYRQWIKE
ncbi:MAG: asparagine synthase (glutamine-hydrolyzing) [Candidatus Nanoarchaeia archaeon]